MPRSPRMAPGGFVYHALNRAVARLPLFQMSRRLLVICAVASIAFSITLAKAVFFVREQAADCQCRANIFSLGTALSSYREFYGCLPPPVITDQFGRPMYSWRVLVLASTELAISNQFDYTKPWDDPDNMRLVESDELMLKNLFCCPSIVHAANGRTNYFYVLSRADRWPRDFFIDSKSPAKILLVESQFRDVAWSEPVDFLCDNSGEAFLRTVRESRTPHPGGWNCVTSNLLPLRVPPGGNEESDLRLLRLFSRPAEKKVGAEKEEVDQLVQKLMKALDEPTTFNNRRRPALLLLGELGAQAAAAIPAIRGIKAEGDEGIRRIAALALAKMSPAR